MQIDFTNSLVIISSSVGAIFLAAGLIQKFYPPEEINDLYGYRTKNSRKNKTQWDFAQSYSANLMIVLGLSYAFSGVVIAMFPITDTNGIYIGLGLMFMVAFLIFYFTERALKQNFKD